MKNKKYIQELLHFLFSEREKIEATGHRIDPDLRKTHKFISDEIQTLHMMLFEDEYQRFSERLAEVFDCPSEVTKRNQS